MKVFSIIFVFCLSSCAVDPIIVSEDYCEKVISDADNNPCVMTYYDETPIQFKAPYFNPNNENEFVFIEINYDSSLYNLCIYNYLTNVKKIIATEVSDVSQPKWYFNNKIIFDIGSSIYSINSNGTNLQQLTFDVLDIWPEWIDSVNICYTNNRYGDGIYLDLPTGLADTVSNFPLTLASISSNRLLSATNGYRDAPDLIYCSLDTLDELEWHILNVNTNNSGYDRIQCINWHPNNEDIYYSKYALGIYKVNIINEQWEQIVDGCFGAWYNYLDISPSGNKIIAEKVFTNYENCTYYLTSCIVLMDSDGRNEVVILKAEN
ncbi:hypothetical protein KBD45_02940 [Candidatus Dojkabacteria bacterium]|nr:hypothetical protein [Chitinophagales bacterium]MBP9758626.1 hypothetical protein [Candidatus Dojkabacteria bacterium]